MSVIARIQHGCSKRILTKIFQCLLTIAARYLWASCLLRWAMQCDSSDCCRFIIKPRVIVHHQNDCRWIFSQLCYWIRREVWVTPNPFVQCFNMYYQIRSLNSFQKFGVIRMIVKLHNVSTHCIILSFDETM